MAISNLMHSRCHNYYSKHLILDLKLFMTKKRSLCFNIVYCVQAKLLLIKYLYICT